MLWPGILGLAGTLVVKVGIVTINMAVLVSPTPTPPKSRSDPYIVPRHCQLLSGDNQRLCSSWVSVLEASCWSPWLWEVAGQILLR